MISCVTSGWIWVDGRIVFCHRQTIQYETTVSSPMIVVVVVQLVEVTQRLEIKEFAFKIMLVVLLINYLTQRKSQGLLSQFTWKVFVVAVFLNQENCKHFI